MFCFLRFRSYSGALLSLVTLNPKPYALNSKPKTLAKVLLQQADQADVLGEARGTGEVRLGRVQRPKDRQKVPGNSICLQFGSSPKP